MPLTSLRDVINTCVGLGQICPWLFDSNGRPDKVLRLCRRHGRRYISTRLRRPLCRLGWFVGSRYCAVCCGHFRLANSLWFFCRNLAAWIRWACFYVTFFFSGAWNTFGWFSRWGCLIYARCSDGFINFRFSPGGRRIFYTIYIIVVIFGKLFGGSTALWGFFGIFG